MSPQVWLEAATQIFFSLGVATGALIALSSYSKRKYNALQDSFIVCITNSATSIFSAIVVFAIVGFRAERTGADIKDVRDFCLIVVVSFRRRCYEFVFKANERILFTLVASARGEGLRTRLKKYMMAS